MIAARPSRRARFGSGSEMRTPGTEVATVENGPRTSGDASSLGSNVSRWLGPPSSQIRMHDVAFGTVGRAEAARSVAQELTDSPSAVRLPSRRTSRLVTPSHRAESRKSFKIGHLFS